VSLQHENAVIAERWAGFQVRRRPDQCAGPRALGGALGDSGAPLDPELVEDIRLRIGDHSGWRLRTVRRGSVDGGGGGLLFDLDSPGGRVTLEAVSATAERPSFETRDSVAYSHVGEVSHDESTHLRRIIELVHRDARTHLSDDRDPA